MILQYEAVAREKISLIYLLRDTRVRSEKLNLDRAECQRKMRQDTMHKKIVVDNDDERCIYLTVSKSVLYALWMRECLIREVPMDGLLSK
jgi:hypothetical protein